MKDEFLKGDMRRTFLILALIITNKKITLNKLVEKSGLPKGTVQQQIKKIQSNQLPNVNLHKNNYSYSVDLKDSFISEMKIKQWLKVTLKNEI